MKFLTFFKEDFWQITPDQNRPTQAFLIKACRVAFSSISYFFQDNCYLKASLLTFYTLMSIVPVLAVTMSVAKGFGFEGFLEKQILQTFREQQDVVSKAIEFSYAFIKHIKSQVIVGFGVIFLFFTVFGLLESIEKTLNQIWKVTKSRNFFGRIFDYLAIIIICPILFAASSSLTIFLNVQLTETFGHYDFLQDLTAFLPTIFKLVPFFLSWILFSFIYLFTPNTRIYFISRVFAGILTGTLFQFWQIAYIQFQVVITSYNTIYGSFAALPLFLIWLQINWIIFLMGAQIAANIENDQYYRLLNKNDSFILLGVKELMALIIYKYVSHFHYGIKPPSIGQISRDLGIPLSTIRKVLDILEKEKILTEVQGMYQEKYQISKNPDLFTMQTLIDILEKHTTNSALVKATDPARKIHGIYHEIHACVQNSQVNFTMKDFFEMVEKKEAF